MYDIYLVYSRQDAGIIRRISRSLNLNGFRTLVEEEDISFGEDFAKILTKRILQAKVILYFHSANSEKSSWTRREVEYALSHKKIVIPILLSKHYPNNEWYDISKFHSIYYEITSHDKFIKNLINILNRYIPEQPLYQSRADSKQANYQDHNREAAQYSKSSKIRIIAISIFLFSLIVVICLLFMNQKASHNTPTIESNDNPIIESLDSIIDNSILGKSEITDSIATLNELKPSAEIEKQNDYYWLYFIISFFAGCGLTVLFLRKKTSNIGNIKLSSNIATKIFIDGDLKKEINAREVYETHLVMGDYLIDFEDLNNEKRHKTFNHSVNSKKSSLIFAEFIDHTVLESKTIKCFIAGSKTLQRERDAIRSVISIMYNQWASKNFRILSYTYEDFDKTFVIGGRQKQYNHFIAEEANWALFIIDGKIGGITLEEFQEAMSAYQKNGRPKILALAKEGSDDDPETALIKKEIIDAHQYWTDYTDIEHMKLQFGNSLNWDLINLFNM